MTNQNTSAEENLSSSEAKVAKFWNRMADGYAKSPVADEESYQKKLAMTQEYFTPSMKVLEFGCGTGSTALVHAPYVQSIHAIDFSSRMIEIAREKAEQQDVKNVKFETKGIDSLAVPNGSYDAVMGMSVLHLVPQKDDVLRKCHSLLKPGGLFISSTICIADMGSIAKYVLPVAHFFRVLPRISCFTVQELKDSITGAGFEIEREFQPAKDKAVFIVARKV